VRMGHKANVELSRTRDPVMIYTNVMNISEFF
jgi:hypothetical protein